MRDDRQKPHDTKDPSYQKVVSWLLKRWAEGDLPPWRKPWTPPPWPDRPHNPFTQAVYQGGNAFTLTLAGMAHDLPLFATYKQIQEHGGQVRGGEQGVPIIVWKEWRPKGEENAPEPGAPQESTTEEAPPRLFARTYAVFNIAQTDGLEHLLEAAKPPATWSPERAGALFEERIAETGVRIERGVGNRAFFRASERLIHLPVEGRFPNASTFYATLLHEAVHSTGPALDRSAFYQKKGMDRDQAYAAEELTAEIGMLLLARRLNVPIAPEDAEQTASYLKGWSLRATVESDPKLLFETARLAQAAVDHLITPEFAQKLEAVQKTRPGQTQTLSGSLREPAPTAPERQSLSVDLDAGERYTFHSDAGHGWLEVTRSDLKALGIEAEITPYSYVKGNMVFLEEDLDAGRFMTALERYMGKEYTWPEVSRGVDDGDHSPIRHYPRYEAPAPARVMREEKDRTVSRGDYVRYLDDTGTEREGVVLDAAQPGEATRLRGIYRWSNSTPGMDGVDQIAPTVLPDHLVEHLLGAVMPGPDLDAIDPRTDAYRRTMSMDDSRAWAEHAVLMAVETARGVTDPVLLRPHSEANKQIYHKVILTHRTDLADHVRQEPIDPDQPILEIQAHPRQRISGVLRDYEKTAVLLDTREFGSVSVEIGKQFLADSLGDDYLRKSLGKPIEVSISRDGRVLSIHNPELGVTPAKDIFASPAIPFGLMPYRNLEQKGVGEITGRLTHIHDTNVLEIQSAGQPLLVSGREPDARHQANMRNLIGHTVTVMPNPEGILQVADRGLKRELGDSREIPVEHLQPGDRIREGNHWMTVHSVEFPGDRVGLHNPVRIRFGDPEGDDTGSTLVPAGTRVSLRTAEEPRAERGMAEARETRPAPAHPPVHARGRRP
ncbi:MAG: ArdC-like ssDNA-binding domain-containing protein [Acidithiobacillus sp.]|jgi:antirestriction protein ArdC|uniref:ArdC family protein n=1 Tax=Acidithiobacillus sp. TaxID=1872118 RepID=UPI00356AF7D3